MRPSLYAIISACLFFKLIYFEGKEAKADEVVVFKPLSRQNKKQKKQLSQHDSQLFYETCTPRTPSAGFCLIVYEAQNLYQKHTGHTMCSTIFFLQRPFRTFSFCYLYSKTGIERYLGLFNVVCTVHHVSVCR